MTNYNRIAQAIDYIKTNFKQQPNLEEVANNIHLSPYHFQRLFTEWAGVSPKKFLQYLSIDYAKQILKRKTVTLFDASVQTGLSGTSRLHDLFVRIEGMTPGEFKNDAENLTINYSFQTCQFGQYLIASTSKGICNLFFYEEKDVVYSELNRLWKKATFKQSEDYHQKQIIQFFNNDFNDSQKIKLHLKGTPFQIKVWEALLCIPEGHLTSYADIAKDIQNTKASRAVGSAIGSNPVGFIIPCHRVIKSVGGIGEYRWGQTRKIAMIGWEAGKVYGDK